jgi:hypothetical protein
MQTLANICQKALLATCFLNGGCSAETSWGQDQSPAAAQSGSVDRPKVDPKGSDPGALAMPAAQNPQQSDREVLGGLSNEMSPEEYRLLRDKLNESVRDSLGGRGASNTITLKRPAQDEGVSWGTAALISLFMAAAFAFGTSVQQYVERRLRFGKVKNFADMPGEKILEKVGFVNEQIGNKERLPKAAELALIRGHLMRAAQMLNMGAGLSKRLYNIAQLITMAEKWLGSCGVKTIDPDAVARLRGRSVLEKLQRQIKQLEPGARGYQQLFDDAVDRAVEERLRQMDLQNLVSARALKAKIGELQQQEVLISQQLAELAVREGMGRELKQATRNDKLAAAKKLQRNEEILKETAAKLEAATSARDSIQGDLQKLEGLRHELEQLILLGVEGYVEYLREGEPQRGLIALEFLAQLLKMEKISITGSSNENTSLS